MALLAHGGDSVLDVRLTILGTGPARDRLSDVASGFGVSDRVTWAGYLADRRTYLAALAVADAFVFPSPAEGFPKVVLKVLEEQGLLRATGKTIVVFNARPKMKTRPVVVPVQGGKGGAAEVSSHKVLTYAGFTNLTAPSGSAGTLLLDPTDLTIAATPTAKTKTCIPARSASAAPAAAGES